MSSRAELVAAALERWETFKSDWPHTKPGDNAFDIGDALARLLRESQPDPAPVGGEDVELIRVARGAALSPVIERPVRNLLEDLATRLETALADVARLREERDSVEAALEACEAANCAKADSLIDLRAEIIALRGELETAYAHRDHARAALAAAEEAKAKAVEEEREACRMIAANYALNCVDSAGRFAANTIGERIRARAGRNDG